MPGLIACRRRWDVGSDDFVFPGIAEIFVRTIWLITVAGVYSRQKAGFACNYGELLHIYCIAMLIILSVQIILSVLLVFVSMKGTIINTAPRRHLPMVLYCKFFVLLPEFAVTVLGTLWCFDLESNCEHTVLFAMRATVLSGWAVLICLLIGIGVVFDPLGNKQPAGSDILMDHSDNTAHQLWKMRCKILCCCVNQDENQANAFNDIAQLIAEYFKGLDIVVTDVAAGLVLIQIEQQKKVPRLQVKPLTRVRVARPQINDSHEDTERSLFTAASTEHIADDPVFPCPQSWMTLPLASHYIKFAVASYGWAMFMYTHLCTGTCHLYPACRCCACISGSGYIMDDNCCGCNTAAIIKTTGIKEQDIIFATFYDEIYQIPFFIALDHVNKSVVISVRGTLSLRDAITDLSADSEPLETPGIQGGRAHKGILQAAKYIYQSILELHLLNKAFEKAPGYQLVITGHSLGAGAASILAVLLRSDYPQLKCFAFSPPGWLLSLPVSRYTEQFICSVVVGVDLVPRLGLVTMEHLKSQILNTIKLTNKPKYKILIGGVWNFMRFIFSTPTSEHPSPSSSNDHTLLLRDSPPPTYTDEIRQDDPENDTNRPNLSTLNVDTQLFMPGHILYIEEAEPSKKCCDVPVYRAAWARAEMFDEIIVSPKMVHDHMPNTVSQALDQLAAGISTPDLEAHILPSQAAIV